MCLFSFLRLLGPRDLTELSSQLSPLCVEVCAAACRGRGTFCECSVKFPSPALWTLSFLLPCPARWPQDHETQVVPESAYTRGRCGARGGREEEVFIVQGRLPARAVSSFPKQTRRFASSHSGQSTVGPACAPETEAQTAAPGERSSGSPGRGGCHGWPSAATEDT